MRRALLVANPAASRFTGALYREVSAILSTTFRVTTVWPEDTAEATRSAREASADGVNLVVAFGGDGVVHHVANGVIDTPTALGIIPAGTTNVLARILRLPRRPLAAARFLVEDPALRTVPAAHLVTEGEEGVGESHALFAIGGGYDAEVVAQAERQPHRKIRFGGVHYARSAAWVLWSRFRHRLPHLRVEADGHRADAVGVVVQVHWPYTYFGRLPLSITPRPGEGLAALVIEEVHVTRVPELLLRAGSGRPLQSVPGLEVWEGCSKLVVSAKPTVWLQSDGELQGRVRRAEISRVVDRLLVAAPGEDRSGANRR